MQANKRLFATVSDFVHIGDDRRLPAPLYLKVRKYLAFVQFLLKLSLKIRFFASLVHHQNIRGQNWEKSPQNFEENTPIMLHILLITRSSGRR